MIVTSLTSIDVDRNRKAVILMKNQNFSNVNHFFPVVGNQFQVNIYKATNTEHVVIQGYKLFKLILLRKTRINTNNARNKQPLLHKV